MEGLKLNIKHSLNFISEDRILNNASKAIACNSALHSGNRKGNDYIGWVNLPSSITEEEIKDIEETAQRLRNECEYIVIVGIGGSYLGARAVIESLSNSFDWLIEKRENPVILYAGHNIGEDYLYELKELLKNKKFGIIKISKSGTTTESAIAFRILKKQLETQVGKDIARNLIVAITDKNKGALRQLSNIEKYKTFVIPDNIGGRYSVLTAVGLLPIAISGINIRELINGAKDIEKATDQSSTFEYNQAAIYAAIRNEFYKNGKKIEILVNYNPKLHFISEWWKQLYGESEGKEGKGIFPSSLNFTTDLHSMGQWIQDGEKTIFETIISIKKPNHELKIPYDNLNLDDLNYIENTRIDEINKMAQIGTRIAHIEGKIPNLLIEIPKLTPRYIGQLIYFFQKACGISGYMLNINPFDQPGVEEYKKNMFALLNKPGYETESIEIKRKI